MLPNIVPAAVASGAIASLAHEARPGHVFEVALPRDVPVVQDVGHRRHVLRDADEAIVVKAEVVPADGGQVVGLAGVREGIVSGEEDALPLQGGEVRIL